MTRPERLLHVPLVLLLLLVWRWPVGKGVSGNGNGSNGNGTTSAVGNNNGNNNNGSGSGSSGSNSWTTTSVNVSVLVYDEKACPPNASLFSQGAELAVNNTHLPTSVSLSLSYMLTEDNCSETGGLLEFVRLMNDPSVSAVVGAVAYPMCHAAVSLATLRSKPFVSWSCSAASPAPSFARTVPPAWHVAQALVSLVRHFGWKYSVVVTSDEGHWPPLGYEIDMTLREERLIVRNFIILHKHGTLREARERLAGIGPLVKAIILCMEVTSSVMYNVMQAAEELGMADGSFTFLALHVLYTLRPHAQANVAHLGHLRHVFIMTFVSPNVAYNETWSDDDKQQVPTVRLPDLNGTETDDYIFHQVYDSVALLASALKRAVQSKQRRLTQLSTMLKYTRQVTYPGYLGPVRMSSQGDRDVTYVLLSFDAGKGAFRSAVLVRQGNVVAAAKGGGGEWFLGRLMPPDEPCILREEDCLSESGVSLSPAHVAAVVCCSLFITFCAIFVALMFRKRFVQNEMTKGPNKIVILPEDLVFVSPRSLNASRKRDFDYKPSEGLEGMLLHHFKVTSLGWPNNGRCLLKENVTAQLTDFTNLDKPDLLKGSHDSLRGGTTNASSLSALRNNQGEETTTRARLNGDLVHVKYILHAQSNFEVRSRTMKELKLMHDLRHENLNPFLGFLADPHQHALIYDYCSRGSLEDILASEDIKLDWPFKLSLLTDLVRGMKYLHSCPVKSHGFLTSRNVVIDSRWVLKITDYGLSAFYETQNFPATKRSHKDLLWTAPELLRSEALFRFGTQTADVYSFSIIMQEVVVRGKPYCMLTLTAEEIIEKVKHPPPMIRPSVSKQAAPPEAINIMRQCWAEVPEMRPDFNAIHEHFKKLNQGKKVNIVDTMFQMLEKYSNNLEELIRDRTEQLAEEKKKTEQLLHRMLPSSVAERLMLGMPVEPETYEEVTIYFSDIVGFTTISAYSTPMEIVDLLNDLYTCFDATINSYNVYKVETIGDAYMVVGGIPLHTADHACQVATMALDLLHQSGMFQIRHMPSTPLKLRIGVHTGSCCTGVVGLTMPRYCLFGDTVNTAARMESTGQAFRIHISDMTKAKLDEAGGYHIQYRGETELKGRGKAVTYWLLGKDGFDKELPTPSADDGSSHGLDEEVVRRGRLSSICYSQEVSPMDLACSIAQLGAGLAVPLPAFATTLGEHLRSLVAQQQTNDAAAAAAAAANATDNDSPPPSLIVPSPAETMAALVASASGALTLPVRSMTQHNAGVGEACVTVEMVPEVRVVVDNSRCGDDMMTPPFGSTTPLTDNGIRQYGGAVPDTNGNSDSGANNTGGGDVAPRNNKTTTTSGGGGGDCNGNVREESSKTPTETTAMTDVST